MTFDWWHSVMFETKKWNNLYSVIWPAGLAGVGCYEANHYFQCLLLLEVRVWWICRRHSRPSLGGGRVPPSTRRPFTPSLVWFHFDSNHCSPLVPPTHPDMGSSSLRRVLTKISGWLNEHSLLMWTQRRHWLVNVQKHWSVSPKAVVCTCHFGG